MSDLDSMRLNARNSLQCGNCTDWLKLEYTSFEKIIDKINVCIDELPMLVCPTCSQTYFTPMTIVLLAHMVEVARAKRWIKIQTRKIANQTKFKYCEQIGFKYDATDYSHIPGLATPKRDGALTPVFFKKRILQYFRSDPSYHIKHVSSTYGTIYHDQWYISYGITRNDKVICWLYDLDKLSEDIQYLFKSSNIDSDHDIASDFYTAQIIANFTPPSPPYKLFSQIESIRQLTQNKFCFKMFKKPNNNQLESASRPIFWNKDNVLPAVNSLHQACIESIKTKALKSEIKKKDPKFNSHKLGGLKLLDKWIKLYCPNLDSSSIMKPLFVLYDFRITFNHNTGSDEETILRKCYERMEVPEKNFENLYDSIVKGVSQSFSDIIKSLHE